MAKRKLIDIEDIKRLYSGGNSLESIGKALNCSLETVRQRLLEQGVKIRRTINPLLVYKFNKLLQKDFFHYFLGFYTGDGNKDFHYRTKGRFSIGLADKQRNRKILKMFLDLLNNIKNITDKTEYRENQVNFGLRKRILFHKKVKKEYKIIQLCFGLKTLKLRLDQWGLKLEKGKKFNLPEYYKYHKKNFGIFIAGFFDADGNINFSNKVNSASIWFYFQDKKSGERMQKFLKGIFGIDSRGYYPKYSNFYPVRIYSNHYHSRFLEHLKKINKYIFPYIKLKKREVEKLKNLYVLKCILSRRI